MVRPGVGVELMRYPQPGQFGVVFPQVVLRRIYVDFPEMEEQMYNFSTAGYQGERSPDRADALVWALTELMLNRGVAKRMRVKGV